MTRPRLVTGARLRYDEVREEHVLLIPEGAVRLNPTAAEVLELCDGERSLDDIVGALSARYDGRRPPRRRRRAGRRHGAERARRSMPPRPLDADRRALLPVPAALPVLLEPARHRRRAVPPRARDRALDPRPSGKRGGSACFSSRSRAASRCCAAISSSSAPARATPACTRRSSPPGPCSRASARQALKSAGLDHVQISIQSPDPEDNDRIAGNRSFEKKIAAARHAKELDFPLTINCVLHRQNLDRIEELLELTLDLGAQRLELANTQYYGWAVPNQDALMPSREQLRRAEEAVQRLPRAGRPEGRRAVGAPRLLRGAAEAVHGRLGPDGDGGRSERRRVAVPGRVDDPRARVRQRPRPSAGVDLERVRRVRALPRDGLDAGAVPDVPARAPGGGLGAAAAARRCGSRATRRPRIRSASSRPITTASSLRASRCRPNEFVYRTMKRPRVPVRSEP